MTKSWNSLVISTLALLSLSAAVTSSAAQLKFSTPADTGFDAQPELAADEAYIVVNLQASGDHTAAISGMTLKSTTGKASIEIPAKHKQPQILRVKAGTYAPKHVVLNSGPKQHRQKLPALPRTSGIRVEPLSITYIGDWTVSHKRHFLVNGNRVALNSANYKISYDPSLLGKLEEQYSRVKNYRPIVASVNGKQLKARWRTAPDRIVASR